MTELVLGVDIGSSRIKVVLMDIEGREMCSAAAPTPFAGTDAGFEATVPSLLGAVGDALQGLGRDLGQAVGVGIAGMAESGAPLDGAGRPLAAILAWHDPRGEEVAERLARRLGPELTNRIGQRLRSVSSLAKLGWLVEQGLTGAQRWLGVPELALHAWTGAEATEISLAARTGCWDVGRGGWMPEAAAAAGFGLDLFPEARPAGSAMGRVTAEAAAAFGLPSGIPVTIAGHDHLVGLVGSGAEPDDLANSVGTAETVVGRSQSLPDVAAALEQGSAVTRFAGGDGWAVLDSAARSGMVLSSTAASLGCSLAQLDALSADAPLLDSPGLRESLQRRQPVRLPDGSAGAVWHTLLNELSSLTAAAADRVVSLVGPRRRLVVFGGGASSGPWLGAKSELVHLPVWRSTTSEAVARGAAVYGGVAARWWPAPEAAPRPPIEPV